MLYFLLHVLAYLMILHERGSYARKQPGQETGGKGLGTTFKRMTKLVRIQHKLFRTSEVQDGGRCDFQWTLHLIMCSFGEGKSNPLQYWKIPRTEEPGGLQSMGSLGVGHD